VNTTYDGVSFAREARGRAARLLACVVCLTIFLTVSAASPRSASASRLVRVGSFASPVYATAPVSQPGRLYVVEQAGRIVQLVGGKRRPEPFLDIRALVKSGGEQGLLSMAFDPGYDRNRLFYVDYTDVNGDTRVVRYRSDGRRGVPGSAMTLLFVKDFASNHNGGQLQFGPDGRLYWGNGDGGSEGDPLGLGQNLGRPFAKIQSLDVRNPAAGWKLVAYGLRNPWRFSFDAKTGDLYIGDVGQNAWEEIDFLRRGATGLVNFGWKRFEGLHAYDSGASLLPAGRYVRPILDYPHSEGCSVTGGYVYRGNQVPAAVGRYFYGDYCSGTVWSVRVVGGKATQLRREPFEVAGLSSFGEDASGNLYLMSVSGGALYRLAR
jgi:glucose/arabinose dehydrogenase